ncbi:conserved hypothetical protein [Hyphomicrobiales bacterium]|jgi:hypothetical protein|nr:conserved hypothetical protein [Hyphomicrobiales bacterium]CAH1696904.1 conserved hypothetical protein [Hyphomicrobiales bacterium]
MSDFRALMFFDRVPVGHVVETVTNDDHFPYLRRGERVLVDKHEIEPIDGELFLVARANGSADVAETYKVDCGAAIGQRWCTRSLNRPRSSDDLMHWLRDGRHVPVVDGPYKPGFLEEKILGRVVGLYSGASVEAPAKGTRHG